MDRESKSLLRKLILDFLILFAVGVPVLLFFLLGKPYHRGFFCNDESLMHPFKESTITNNMLYIIGIFLPIFGIVSTEVIIYRRSLGQSSLTFMGHVIPGWVVNSYKTIGVFCFGAACSQLSTDIAKYSIGRLRPHFFAVCKPNIDCTKAENQNRYFEDFTCMANEGTRMLKEVRLSFPSGHSSFSAYTMLFLAMFLQARMTWKGSKLLKHFLQYICLMLCWGTAMSRISNYKHHWSDVLSGLIIGVVVSVLTVVYVSDLFTPQSKSPEAIPLNSETSRNGGKRDSQMPYYNSMYSQPNPVELSFALNPVPGESDSNAASRPKSPSLTPLKQNSPNPAV